MARSGVHAIDPQVLAAAQLERDRIRLERVRPWAKGGEELLAHKIDRMVRSPLAFLRGAAPLFYDVLAAIPSLAAGPAGRGSIAGDLHLENFGAFRAQAAAGDTESKAVFDLNDFDECTVGPWRIDVLRLTTSLILGGRELGADGRTTLELCDALLDAYAARGRTLPAAPRTVRALLGRVTRRSRAELLAARTQVRHGVRCFVRDGERYLELDRKLRAEAAKAFRSYVREHVPKSRRAAHEICDMAFRVAGTGSLGCLRVALLVKGKGGRDGHWVYDMKEEDDTSVATPFAERSKLRGADRVEAGLRACLKGVPRGLGEVTLRHHSMLVRRLTPQEDKLDLTHFPRAELPALARLLGALTARAHLRGRTREAVPTWSRAERDAIVDRAVRLAGIHEAAYLAYCRLAMSSTSHATARRK